MLEQTQFTSYLLMFVFANVFPAIGTAWLVLGLKTYGNGSYTN